MVRTYRARGTTGSARSSLAVLFLCVVAALCGPAVDAMAQVISGTKFEDLNGDGIQNVGEVGLAGWTIAAYNPATGTTVTTATTSGGGYSISVTPGTWTVREVQQSGWTQSHPQAVSYTVTIPGSPASGLHFGNRPPCHNSGMMMMYQAGVNDTFRLPTEVSFIDPGLNSYLTTTFAGTPLVNRFDQASGAYMFGHSFIGLAQPDCYIMSARLIVRLRALGAASNDDIIGFVQGSTGVWSLPVSALYGAPWMPGATLLDTLDLAALPVSSTGITNILAALADGDIDFYAGDRTMVDFLKLEVTYCCGSNTDPGLGAIEGIKFNDLNANGIRDAGEPGLPYWTIKARNTTTNQIIAVQTTSSGAFTFANVTAGTWSVYEEQQNGWVQTAPSAVFHRITVGVSQTVSGLEFGNIAICAQPATLSVPAGADDNFGGGTEPSSPDSELMTVMGTIYSTSAGYVAAGFDDPDSEEIFGHTFSNLLDPDCYVVGARLTLKLRALSGNPDNDRIGIVQGTTIIWGSSIGELFNTTWNNTEGTVTLNLAAMPGTNNTVTNLLAALQDNDFDFFFQDDTSIDYATLELDYCCFEAHIEGAKYNDLNNNGARDSGEPGLQGWIIKARHNSGQTYTDTTDANGNYSFPSVTTGTWTVYEVQQSGWAQTSPTTVFHPIAVPSGPHITGLDFGNTVQCSDPVTVRDTVGVIDNFSQANGDENTDPSSEMEEYMDMIYSHDSTTELDEDPTEYDRIIGHTFRGYLPEGCYVTDAKLTVRVRNQQHDADNDRIGFAADGIGIWSGELASLIPGWNSVGTTATFTLDLANLPGTVITNILAALQDDSLDFYIQDDTGIDYAILEVDYCCYEPPNYFEGTKFNDLDHDGVRDPGEPGIANWQVTAYNPATGTTVVVLTDANGNYQLPVDDGTWVVYETQQPAWVQTTPLQVFYTRTVSGSQTESGLDFGNTTKCDVPETVAYTAGDPDTYTFDPGTDMADPDGDLIAYLNTMFPGFGPSFFDDSTPDYPFAHTFRNLQRPGCYIVGARLTIAMQALPGASADDVIGFAQNGQEVWSTSISNLTGGAPWVVPNNGTFVLDLRNLYPSANSITDIIASLMDGTLDVFVYDNTSIDYMILEVDYCCPPPPATKYGANHSGGAMQANVRPNPFSDYTALSYELREAGPVRISIVNALGVPVYTFDPGIQNTGIHEVQWDGVDMAGAPVANGVYVYRIETPGGNITGQVVLQK